MAVAQGSEVAPHPGGRHSAFSQTSPFEQSASVVQMETQVPERQR